MIAKSTPHLLLGDKDAHVPSAETHADKKRDGRRTKIGSKLAIMFLLAIVSLGFHHISGVVSLSLFTSSLPPPPTTAATLTTAPTATRPAVTPTPTLPQTTLPTATDTPQAKKPTVILHIGPGKHGTTFLQCSLGSDDSHDILLKDNYTYLGTNPTVCSLSHRTDLLPNTYADATNIFSTGRKTDVTLELQPSFVELMNSTYPNSAILVFETFSALSNKHVQLLVNHLSPLWDVRPVVAYRPYYSYIPSLHNQDNKAGGRVWLWPGTENGQKVLPFSLEGPGRASYHFRDGEKDGLHPSHKALRHFQQFVDSPVSVIELSALDEVDTAGDPYLTEFLCTALTNTPHGCRAAQEGVIGTSNVRSNPSHPLNYDLIATAAYELGLVRKGVKRRRAFSAIQHRQEKVLNRTSNDFELICLSEESLERFFRVSLSVEQKFLGESEERTVAHRAGFNKQIAKKTFCSVNTTAVLEDSGWHLAIQEI